MPFRHSSLFAVAALVASSVAIPAIAGDGGSGGVPVKTRPMSTTQTVGVISDTGFQSALKAPSLFSGPKSTGYQATNTSRFTGKRGLAFGVNPDG